MPKFLPSGAFAGFLNSEDLITFGLVLCIMRERHGAIVTSLTSISTEDLIRRCSSQGEIGVWEEFVRRFHRPIATVALRTARRLGDFSAQAVDDLIQETYLKLCANDFRLLRQFEQRHPDGFLGFVKVVTANVVRDHFKLLRSQRRSSELRGDFPDDFEAASEADAIGSPNAIERGVLIREIEHHLSECMAGTDRDRNILIFWLYYRAGLTASAIAAQPGIDLTIKGVESTILRITRDLRARLALSDSVLNDQSEHARKGTLPAQSF